jgi:hypothetical protein
MEALAFRPNPETKRYIYERIFTVAEKAGNTHTMVRYGRRLYEIDHTDTLPKMALALSAQKKDFRQPLQYAKMAGGTRVRSAGCLGRQTTG